MKKLLLTLTTLLLSAPLIAQTTIGAGNNSNATGSGMGTQSVGTTPSSNYGSPIGTPSSTSPTNSGFDSNQQMQQDNPNSSSAIGGSAIGSGTSSMPSSGVGVGTGASAAGVGSGSSSGR